MKEGNINKILAAIVVAIVVLAVFVGIVFNSEVIEEKKDSELFAQIRVDENTGVVPFDITFKSLVMNTKGNVQYLWDFGDGTTSNEMNPIHIYQTNGSYTCTLKITDSSGKEKTDFVEILAKRNKAPDIGISINYKTMDRKYIPILPRIISYAGTQQRIINALYDRNPMMLGEGQIECYAQVDDPEDDEIVSYEWVVTPDDGNTRTGITVTANYTFNGSHIKIPELATWRVGRYVIVLTVTDSAGNKANTSLEFQVDKNTEEVKHNQKITNFKNLLNSWNLYFNPILGVTVALFLLKLMAKNGFTGINIVLLVFAKGFLHLDISEQRLRDEIKLFFNKHPIYRNVFNNSFNRWQDRLEKLKNIFPKLTETFDGIIEFIEIFRENWGFKNNRPIIIDYFPSDDAKNVDRNLSKVYVIVEDPEGDPFNIRIHGDYISEIDLTGQYNNTFSAPLITPLPANKEIVWYVNASTEDGVKWTNSTYKFTTFYE